MLQVEICCWAHSEAKQMRSTSGWGESGGSAAVGLIEAEEEAYSLRRLGLGGASSSGAGLSATRFAPGALICGLGQWK